MASIRFSPDPSTPSYVDLGEEPVTKTVTLAMGARTADALVNLVNEQRAILESRAAEGEKVVGPVETVEEALLDAIGGIGAAGGSEWFRRSFLNTNDLLQRQVEAIDLAIGGFFAAAHIPSDPAPHIEQLHWIAKKILRQPVKGVQYAFAEEPPQPEGIIAQQAFARGESDQEPPPELKRARKTLERYLKGEPE